MARIRISTDNDIPALCEVHRQAFGEVQGPEIVELVCALLEDTTAQPLLSLVAESGSGVAGHVLFTPVVINDAEVEVSAHILAPLAVLPGQQSRGIGGALIRDGLRRLSAQDVDLVFVLGYPDYYTRFGFKAAGRHGLTTPHPIPAAHQEGWMVQELKPGLLGRVRGQITCAGPLNHPQHW